MGKAYLLVQPPRSGDQLSSCRTMCRSPKTDHEDADLFGSSGHRLVYGPSRVEKSVETYS